jgi:hypothetical protein
VLLPVSAAQFLDQLFFDWLANFRVKRPVVALSAEKPAPTVRSLVKISAAAVLSVDDQSAVLGKPQAD